MALKLDQNSVPFNSHRVWRGSSSPHTLILGFTMLYNAYVGHSSYSVWRIRKLYFSIYFPHSKQLEPANQSNHAHGMQSMCGKCLCNPYTGQNEPFSVTRLALSPFNTPQTFPRNVDLKHSRQPQNETPGAPRTRWVLLEHVQWKSVTIPTKKSSFVERFFCSLAFSLRLLGRSHQSIARSKCEAADLPNLSIHKWKLTLQWGISIFLPILTTLQAIMP